MCDSTDGIAHLGSSTMCVCVLIGDSSDVFLISRARHEYV